MINDIEEASVRKKLATYGNVTRKALDLPPLLASQKLNLS